MFSQRFLQFLSLTSLTVASTLCLVAAPAFAADPPDLHRGYYTDPALYGDTILFTSEGDLWSVGIHGGAARRLTSAAGTENKATVSPDGKTAAFSANYEGPTEVYTIPVGGDCPSDAPGTEAPSLRDGRLTAG
jgi:tricorn protease